jgi:DNA-binding transcriptional MerR regulator
MVKKRQADRGSERVEADAPSASAEADLVLSDAEVTELETRYARGITAVQVVDIFRSRGMRFSEATFRKYVQQGLLPRSRRIGRKGKHRGSMGVYPPKTVRRINEIKAWMGEGYTIEEIEEQFLRFAAIVETVEEGMNDVLDKLEEEIESPRFDIKAKKNFKREIGEARKTADELLKRIGGISERVSASSRGSSRGAGAAGSAEDLL